MKNGTSLWVRFLMHMALRHPWRTVGLVSAVTVVMFFFSEHLELRMNWTDLLPESDPIVASYREVQDRFGEANLVIALKGERDDVVAMADMLVPRLEELKSLYHVQASIPRDFIRNHGFVLMKPELFERSLDMFRRPDPVGMLGGLNDDYEREYASSDTNLRRDEVEIARSVLGLTRTLEIVSEQLRGSGEPADIEDAVDALLLGEPYLLSLDRSMLLIACTPVASMATELDSLLLAVSEVQDITDELSASFPDVDAALTGMAKIGQDEMESIGIYTQFLMLGALILIYLLLARTFKSWLIPILALIPLAVGIIWTTGVLYILFGGLNLFTAMIMLVLLGLGIDFSIHLIARFQEGLSRGNSLEDSLAVMLGEAGVGVITGALTTALAFATLMTADTNGVFEFGAASGLGVVLALAAIFITLPAILVLYHRRRKARGIDDSDNHAYNWLGSMARTGWRHPVFALVITATVIGACIWAMRHIEFEYDFLELEPAGLTSVELQREIPDRFGLSDHYAWLVTDSVEESRELKEQLKDKPLVGEIVSISDYLPSSERLENYAPQLQQFRADLDRYQTTERSLITREDLLAEIERLWDNLDLMSNLAYLSGLDRIVKVIDTITGYDTATDATDTTAVLPTLLRQLEDYRDPITLANIDKRWTDHMMRTIRTMADPSIVALEDLPPAITRAHLPRVGEGFLLQIFPRKSLWNKEEMVRFAEQTGSVDEGIAGTEQLFLVMMDRTLAEGGYAARLALIVIAVLVIFHFRGLFGLLALVPLCVGALLMLGLMFIFGMKYNYMNLIAVPIILGIGIDDGVHALHRFKHQRGDQATRVYDAFRFIGRAILLTSLTTMIGFGSVAFYSMRGMASFGIALFMGVGACFVATVTVLPPLLRLFARGGNSTNEDNQ